MEARHCYRKYERTRVQLNPAARSGDWHGCQYRGCDKPTKKGADRGDGYGYASLCDEHLTIECAIEALGLADEHAGDSVHS